MGPSAKTCQRRRRAGERRRNAAVVLPSDAPRRQAYGCGEVGVGRTSDTTVPRLMSNLLIFSVLLAAAGSARAASAAPEAVDGKNATGLYAGWLQMYDLKFDDAHRSFAAWKQ